MIKSDSREMFRKIFSDYPARLGLVMGYLRRITDTLFPEMDKTFDGNSNPEVPAFYWIRQAHCFLSRYQEALYSSREKLNRKRKNKIQKIQFSFLEALILSSNYGWLIGLNPLLRLRLIQQHKT